jgi:hypothetical protein
MPTRLGTALYTLRTWTCQQHVLDSSVQLPLVCNTNQSALPDHQDASLASYCASLLYPRVYPTLAGCMVPPQRSPYATLSDAVRLLLPLIHLSVTQETSSDLEGDYTAVPHHAVAAGLVVLHMTNYASTPNMTPCMLLDSG